MSVEGPAWLGRVPAMQMESHYGDRSIPCFSDRPKSIFSMLEEAVAKRPQAEALICGDERLSYGQFEDLVCECAAGLVDAGIGKGDRVAILLANGVAFPVVLFAVLKVGAIAVPMNIREQTDGLRYMLAHCGAKLLLFERELEARLPSQSDTPELLHRLPVCSTDPIERLLLRRAGQSARTEAVDDEDTGIILYTSGTTGRPKGAMLTHLGVVHSAMHYECCMGLGPNERSIAAVPLSHVTGVIALIAAMVRVAGALIIMSEFKARRFLELAARERMTHSLMVPAMYNLCLLDEQFDPALYQSWRIGGYGGAPMAPATISQFAQMLPNLKLMNAYGATETTSPVTLMPPSETARLPDSVGQTLPCADVRVVDDSGLEVAEDQAGELWLGGPMVVPGYWNNRQATIENFVEGYWRSGDIGSKDAEGFVRVFDRKKDMINRGGYKIYSVEVEHALMSFPGVLEVAVVPQACPVLGERVRAFVYTTEKLRPSDLATHCAALLADYKVPEHITLVEHPLPRNANGKLLKRELV